MADELQKNAWDTTRALTESGGDGLVARELVTNQGVGANGNGDVLELIQKIGASFYHYPSEEKLSKGITSYTSVEDNDSGAQMIGVSADNFTTLTGDTDLQSVLDSIDTLLGTTSGPYVRHDGATTLSGEWDVGGSYGIVGIANLESNSIAGQGTVVAGGGGASSGSAESVDVSGVTYVEIVPAGGGNRFYNFTNKTDGQFIVIENTGTNTANIDALGSGTIYIDTVSGEKNVVARYHEANDKWTGTKGNVLNV